MKMGKRNKRRRERAAEINPAPMCRFKTVLGSDHGIAGQTWEADGDESKTESSPNASGDRATKVGAAGQKASRGEVLPRTR